MNARQRAVKLTGTEGPDFAPDWFPDGTKLVFISTGTQVEVGRPGKSCGS